MKSAESFRLRLRRFLFSFPVVIAFGWGDSSTGQGVAQCARSYYMAALMFNTGRALPIGTCSREISGSKLPLPDNHFFRALRILNCEIAHEANSNPKLSMYVRLASRLAA